MKIIFVLLLAVNFGIILESHAASKTDRKVVLAWKPSEGSIEYGFEVSRGSDRMSESVTPGTQVELSLEPGEYFFRVRAKDRAGRFSEWSGKRNFQVRPWAPEALAVENVDIEYGAQGVEVRWMSLPKYEYRVQLKLKGESKDIFDERVSKSPLTIPVDEQGQYEVKVSAVANDVISLDVPPAVFAAKEVEKKNETSGKKTSIDLAMGVSSLNYSDSARFNNSALVLTPKFNYLRALNTKWSLGLNTFFTAFHLTESAPGTQFRVFGANGRIGKRFYVSEGGWELFVFFGGYYITSFSAIPTIGFKNMAGPQVYPTFRKSIGTEELVYFYGKFSPIINTTSTFSPTFTSYEMAIGGGWKTRKLGFGLMTYGLDYSNLHIVFAGNSIDIHALTLGLAWNW